MTEKKYLQSYLAPRREIIKKSKESLISNMAASIEKNDVDLPCIIAHATKAKHAEAEIEAFTKKKEDTNDTCNKIIDLFRLISSKSFVVVPPFYRHREVYINADHIDKIQITDGYLKLAVEIAEGQRSDILVCGRILKEGIVAFDQVYSCLSESFLPMSETAVLIDSNSFHRHLVSKTLITEDKHGNRVFTDYKIEDCRIALLQ